MYRKIRLGFLAVIFLVCLILVSGTRAQLNFSTGWGKRSERRGASDSMDSVNCGSRGAPTLEQLLNVYHSIQMEAQKMLDCRKLNE
ncbi:adipokinetic prohormone type 3 [Lasioglossum baleicum]|uniref:adipokinetic prohormone type 3 n=1 Tax=Lasioglossum baleicum TaxID=434251 RepID=UPI003FCE87D1